MSELPPNPSDGFTYYLRYTAAMTPRPKLYKRIRRKLWGGLLTVRVYEDGTAKIRFDHPSNDPEIEMAAGGHLVRLARQWFADVDIDMRLEAMSWNDDPPK